MLTIEAAGIALSYGVPIQILTKCTEWLYDENLASGWINSDYNIFNSDTE